MTPVEPKCSLRACRHFLGVLPDDPEKTQPLILICKAFPEAPGIPNEIAYGDNKHKKPYPGDNGILYKRREAGE